MELSIPKIKKSLHFWRELSKPQEQKKSGLKKFLVFCDVFVILSS